VPAFFCGPGAFTCFCGPQVWTDVFWNGHGNLRFDGNITGC
jgi:hypothetical protein